MKLRNASENYVVPPIGRYKFKIVATEAANAKSSGAPMIKITGELREPAQFAGAQFFDNMITDDAFGGAGFGKKKLRGLGINVDSEVEVPDAQIANQLLGLEGWVDVDHEQINDKNPSSGAYDVPRFNMENGQRVPANKLVPKGYYTHNVGAQPSAQAQAPQTFVPQAQPQLQGYAPQAQGGFQGAPQGFAPPQGQFVPQGYAPQGPTAQQGWAPPADQGQFQQAPQGYAPQGNLAPQGGFPGFPQAPNGSGPAQGGLPWAQPPQAQQAQPEAGAATGGGKRGKKS